MCMSHKLYSRSPAPPPLCGGLEAQEGSAQVAGALQKEAGPARRACCAGIGISGHAHS